MRYPDGSVNVALTDLDRDGVDEIIVQDIWNIYVLRGEGTPFSSAWPLRPYPQLCGPLAVADVNGDGRHDLVISKTIASSSPSDPGGWTIYLNRP